MPRNLNTQRATLEKGWDCECGTHHEFGAYAAAHWTVEIVHTCDCGRKHAMKRGVVELIKPLRKDFELFSNAIRKLHKDFPKAPRSSIVEALRRTLTGPQTDLKLIWVTPNQIGQVRQKLKALHTEKD